MVMISELDLTGDTDNTPRLQQFITNCPSTRHLELPPGRIRMDDTVTFLNKNSIYLTGPQTTLYQSTLGYRERAFFSLDRSQLISLVDIGFLGANPFSGQDEAAYDPNLEAQHAVRTAGSQRVYLKRLRVDHIWGDGFYIGAARGKTPALTEDVLVEDCIVTNAGRQGSTVTGGKNVVFNRMIYHNIRRAIWDIEPLGPDSSWQARNVHMLGSIIGYHRLLLLANGGGGPNVSDIVLADNLQLDTYRGFFDVDLGCDDHRNNYWIMRNTSMHSPVANPIVAHNINNLFVVLNNIPTQDRVSNPLVRTNGCNYVCVGYNRFGPQTQEVSGDFVAGSFIPPPPTPSFTPYL
jgi:hypothetical protein